jgi:hypothetical protein
MLNALYKPSVTGNQLSKAQPRVACPVCGGLQCLCRPRFFAGQLLTEEDLNRLDTYIIEKNRLHNRYLHGSGTVCGLEVLCHRCKGQLVVKSGYAIGPCGEDIIVYKDDIVDVCALIKKCREKERQDWECEAPYPKTGEDDGCKDMEETWVLAIRYEEKPSRGITALRGGSEASCSPRYNCGDSSGYGCQDDKNNGGSNSDFSRPLKQTPPQCEPTIMCEGYRYEVFRAPDPALDDIGRMQVRFMKCYQEIANAAKMMPSKYTEESTSQLQELCCRTKSFLVDFVKEHPTIDCQLGQYVDGISCPLRITKKKAQAILNDIMMKVQLIYLVYVRHCLCMSLMPPCPDPVDDPRVVLATFTVRKDDCSVIRVCNWTTLRKFVTSFPGLQYWLSWLPFTRQLREVLEKVCCAKLLGAAPERVKTEEATAMKLDNIPSARSSAATGSFGRMLFNMVNDAATPVSAAAIFNAMKGAAAEKGAPSLQEDERDNPLQFLVLSALLQPLVGDILGDRAGMLRRLSSADVTLE